MGAAAGPDETAGPDRPAGGPLFTQVVPRPPGARPGAPAPWSSLPPGARAGIGLEAVLHRLAGAGQLGTAPDPMVGGDRWTGAEHGAAVLVALFEEGGEARVVLTRRSSSLRSHRGEVSFPGGRIDVGEDAPRAALREAAEEVGLAEDAPTLVGWLHPVVTFASGAHITPVVATLAGRPHLAPNPAEVDRVFDVALAELVADGVFHEERWTVPGLSPVPSGSGAGDGDGDGAFPVWFYEAAGELIWGATARMLTELLSLSLGLPPPPSSPRAFRPRG